jgi:hypothetical protein
MRLRCLIILENGQAVGVRVPPRTAHSTAYRTTMRVRRPEGHGLNDLLGRLFGLVRSASQHSKTSR